jgi:hypothetical protein
MLISRRQAIAALAAVAVYATKSNAGDAALPPIIVTKDPNCSCCGGWVDHLKHAGFTVTVVTATNLKATKTRLGVPEDLASCHTAEIGAYVIEGHVPALAIRRLLDQKPQAIGLAVPGMPAGSPGMGGEPEVYDVILFATGSRRSFGRYRADQAL